MITRETDYALRLLRALLDGTRKTVPEAAHQEMVPLAFAYKILKKLDKAGMVEVSRGAEGGCRLLADLSQISLYDLMVAMGEDCRLSSCMESDYPCSWRAAHGGCSVHGRLEGIQQRLNEELKSHSLKEILSL